MTPEQELLAAAALTVFRLNGQFLAVSEELSRPAGLTATRWQVLGAVLGEPATVSDIARAMGITRQSVQRTADRLVDDGLAEYLPNPAHQTARLVAPTDAGHAAVKRIDPAHKAFAKRLAEQVGESRLAETVAALSSLSEALDQLEE